MAARGAADDASDDDFEPPHQKRGKKATKSRFRAPATNKEMEVLSKGYVPANTRKNTTWARRVFTEWRAERNKIQTEACLMDLFDKPDVSRLNYWLSRFVTEVRRQDGDPYPPKTTTASCITHHDVWRATSLPRSEYN